MSFSHFDEIYAICCESVKESGKQVSKGEEKEHSLV